MRRALAGIALAVTSMVALSFLIPLALLVREQARDRVTTAAEQRAAALSPVLALTTRRADVQQAVAELGSADQLVVRLPDGGFVGTPHASEEALDRAVRGRETLAVDTADGWAYLQPVVLRGDRVAVVEAYVPAADLTRGVTASWGVMALLAVGLVGGSVLVADRLGARVEPDGPPELQEAGAAFNTMADRVVDLLAVERELVADLSHRLRTPLTALYLEADRMGATPSARRVTEAAGQLERELDSIIAAARTPLAAAQLAGTGAGTAKPCDVAEVVAMRLDFWSVLAAQQDRPFERSLTPRPAPVAFPEDDLAAVVDALIGNVFRHTPQGTRFVVRVERRDRHVRLTVDDAGPGVADPEAALTRGVSVGGSTGLGLDIVARAARTADGELTITRAPLGGARVTVSFALADARAAGGGDR
ncbi:sensor histidine kinase [Streptomyces rubrogriseus]|uniref:histidine kinase n=1 Tax=Streptomyces rubrogriseus TaxID=194673 RepID=A0A6G3TEY9_9ACTN|nr:HAMP domain-containing sensor histidine kinase [Streptomyces rubrogriseus]NEC35163.1 HAMP domain-containing histidine kinase [Streptomyces rubrogriseus]